MRANPAQAAPSRRQTAGGVRRVIRGGYQIIPLLLLTSLLPACQPKPVGETTRLSIADIDQMTGQMAHSLLASDALSSRSPGSPDWAVSIDKVLNLSDEVITENEQWSIMAQVRGATPLRTLADTKAVRFLLPPERVAALRQSEDAPEFHAGFGDDRQVTHTMAATFRSITRAQSTKRSDQYYCQFDLVDLKTGETIWSDRFELKRQARGHVWD